MESSVDHLATPRPPLPPYPPATPCAALPLLIHSPFGKKGKETTELRWRHARGETCETRETIETGRRRGEVQKGLGSGTAVGRRDCETDRHRHAAEGMVAVAPSFAFISTSQLAKEAKRYLARRQSAGAERADDDGRRRRTRTRTAGRSYGWTRGPGKR